MTPTPQSPGPAGALLPCPFCGESLVEGQYDGIGQWRHTRADGERGCFLAGVYVGKCDVGIWNTRADSGWIACAERMPEMDALVLVAGGLARWRGGSRWDSQMHECFNRMIEWEVTHWMPLPAPSSSAAESGGG